MTTNNSHLFIVPQLFEGVGPINAAAKKIAEQMGVADPREVFRGINSGEWTVTRAAPIKIPVWKTVKLGLHKSPKDYRAAIRSAKMKIGDCGDDTLSRISCSQDEVDLGLVVMSVADLGFKDGARYADICTKAVELGLKLCPAEVGPALRLQYGDQTRGEWVMIAMEAITDRDGVQRIFAVEHDSDRLWLQAYYGFPDCGWNAGCRFVFVRPR